MMTRTHTHIIVVKNGMNNYFHTVHDEGENVNVDNSILAGIEAGTHWPSTKWSEDVEASRTDHPLNGNFVIVASKVVSAC